MQELERSTLTVLGVAACAATAPQFPDSTHWWAKVVRDGLELRATGGLLVTAPAGRLTRVAVGAALLAARLAMAVAGARPHTTLLPDPRRPALLAVLRPGGAAEPNRDERVLHRALVCPEPLAPGRPVGPALPLLRRAADAERAWLRTVTDRADRNRLLAVLGREEEDSDPEAVLIVLGSHSGPAGEIRAGQALRRVLLTAQALGLHGDIVAGPVDLSGVRAREVPGAGIGLLPQVVLEVRPFTRPAA